MWDWFKDKLKPTAVDYYKLSKNKKAALAALDANPDLLFKVVSEEDYVLKDTFLDLLILNKTVKESDLVQNDCLDWFKLSTRIPLSIETLEKYKDKVDWEGISSSHWYVKDDEFKCKFGGKLTCKMDDTCNSDLDIVDMWDWFKGTEKPRMIDFNYHELARDKARALAALDKNPDLLFKVVVKEDKYTYNKTFMDLLIENKTVKESDLVVNDRLDWFKLSTHVPLSNETLKKYKDKVDWEGISSSSWYVKDEEFIRRFHDRILWRVCTCKELRNEKVFQLFFKDRIVPLLASFIVYYRKFILEYVLDPVNDISALNTYENTLTFIQTYGTQKTEEVFERIEGALAIDPELFAKECNHVPRTARFIDILKKNVNWSTFILTCKPDLEFIEKHIVPSATETDWQIISDRPLPRAFIDKYRKKLNMKSVIQHTQLDIKTIKKVLGNWTGVNEYISTYPRLSPEFIDKNANGLDWYFVCEYQILPEWLMEKHLDKLNWGQVSQYQKMSDAFLAAHWERINHLKLATNKHNG